MNFLNEIRNCYMKCNYILQLLNIMMHCVMGNAQNSQIMSHYVQGKAKCIIEIIWESSASNINHEKIENQN